MPIVSVIVPSYNSAHLVGGAIESVLAQTCSDFELLVIDDGSSSGNTGEVVARYAADPRIRYVFQQNRGLPGARNAGAAIAVGRYFAFLDADDFLAPTALEILVREFESSGADWGNVGVLKLDGGKRLIRHASMPDGNLLHAILEDDFVTRCPFLPSKSFFAIGQYDEKVRMREDWDLNIRLIEARKKCVVIDEPIYLYSRTEGSITTGNNRKLMSYTEMVLSKHHKRLADAGDKQIAKIYAKNMWALARQYVYETKDIHQGLRCAAESLRYDASPKRMLHPFLHRSKALFR